MSTPSLVVELALGQAPLTANASATWTDVSAYVSGNDEQYTDRGRNNERDVVEAGTAIIVLRNTDRRFDPSYNAGPYYGQLKPMLKIRIGALWAGTTYYMFYGYVESFTPDYPGGSVSTCTLECVDAFKYLGMRRVFTTANRAQEVSGDRISWALDNAAWPSGERSIAVGDIQVASMLLDDSALAVIGQTTRAERGNFYISRNGTATFEDRSYRSDLASINGTWGDKADGTERPYSSLSVRSDDADIFNQISVTRRDGLEQYCFDTSSQTDYFRRDFISTGLPYVDDAAGMVAAQTMLAWYKTARVRLDRMVIDPGVRDTWVPVLSRDLSQRIIVNRRYLTDADLDTWHVHIDRITWRITKGLWICTWQLTPHFSDAAGTAAVMTGSRWRTPTLLNSWVDYGGTVPPAGYWKDDDGWVYLRGAVKNGTLTAVIFTLPLGYRPPYNEQFPVVSNDAFGVVHVQSDGDVVADAVSAAWVQLNTIRFKTS